MRNLSIMKVKKAHILGTSEESGRRKLRIEKTQMITINKETGEAAYNRTQILKVMEELCGELHHSDVQSYSLK